MWPFSRIHNLEHETIRQEGRVISYKNRLRRIRELSECPPDCDLEAWIRVLAGAAKTHWARTATPEPFPIGIALLKADPPEAAEPKGETDD